MRCINRFASETSLEDHEHYCKYRKPQRVVVCNNILEFNHYNRSMRVPFVIYADFESSIIPMAQCTNNPDQSYTVKQQKHIPNSFSYYIKCFDDNLYCKPPVTYIAESDDDDVALKFIIAIEQEVRQLYDQIKKNLKPMIFTKADEKLYKNCNICHIC